MPAYDICYLEEDGALVCAFTVQFDSEMRAKILAHAMKPADCHRLEIWCDKELVYHRPDTLDARRPQGHTRLNEPGFFASVA